MDDSPLFGLIVFIAFLIVNAIMYGFSAAIRTINEAGLQKQSEEGSSRAAKILHIIDDPTDFTNTVQITSMAMAIVVGYLHLNNYARIVYGFLVNFASNYIRDGVLYFIAYIIVLLYLLFLILAIGVLLPKKFGAKYPEAFANALVGIVNMIMAILTPARVIITFITGLFLRVFGIDPNTEYDKVTEEDIMSMVNEGHEQGNLLASEAEMITNIFELNDKEAKDIMTHRKSIVAIDGEWTLEETVDFILKESNSRFPVFIGDIDNIIGLVHFKDVMIFADEENIEQSKIKDIEGLVRTIHFIPETRNINLLFKEMQSNNCHMEIVVDEYGQTAGLVAMEDILEEIVGNILDEYDYEENNIVKIDEYIYNVKGGTPLEEITDELNIEFDEEDYDTLNGYLISKLDRIPEENDKPVLEIDGYVYRVLTIENKMISLVQVTLPKESEEDNSDNEEN